MMQPNMMDSQANDALGIKGDENTQQDPMDSIIADIDSYIKDPSLVTKETLTSLKDQLTSLKADIDGAMNDVSPDDNSSNLGNQGNGSFSEAIRSRQGGY